MTNQQAGPVHAPSLLTDLCGRRHSLRRVDRRLRQGKREGRALVQFRSRPDRAAMAEDDSLDDGQADAAAGKFTRAVQALEYTEQRIGVTAVEPTPLSTIS